MKIWGNILIVVLGFIFLAFLFQTIVLAWVAFAIGSLSLVVPGFARRFDWLWLKSGAALGWFNSRVILGVVYFVVLVPIALISRIFGKDKLRLRRSNTSLYVERDHLYTAEDLQNPF